MNLKTILDTLSYPVAYDHFNTATSTPFIVYRRFASDNFSADNKVYKKFNNYYIELYTAEKSPSIEEALENLLDTNEIYYEVESEEFIQDEKVYEIMYSISLEEGD